MATRATYQFKSQHSPVVTCYVHWDGYLEGAAAYFWDMISCGNERGGLACRFIRGVSLAEITRSHDAHSDTEYRYDLDQSDMSVVAYKSFRDDDDGYSWGVVYSGSLVDFINRFHPEGFRVYSVPTGTSKSYKRMVVVTLAHAIDLIWQYTDQYCKAISNGWIGNAHHVDGLAVMVAEAIGDTELRDSVAARCAAALADYEEKQKQIPKILN